MRVYVNSESKDVQDNCSLTHLLSELNLLNSKGVAIALNESVIPKSEWDVKSLSSEDRVMIIRATQGG